MSNVVVCPCMSYLLTGLSFVLCLPFFLDSPGLSTLLLRYRITVIDIDDIDVLFVHTFFNSEISDIDLISFCYCRHRRYRQYVLSCYLHSSISV